MKIAVPLRLLVGIFALIVVTISLPTQATIIRLAASIDGAQANAGAGTGSLGTGLASMLYDDISNSFSWDISWSGLTGNVTVAHFHGPALPNMNAGVEVAISTASNPTSGNAILNAAQAADLLAGLWYVNIHTDSSPGGEIRGQVIRVSEPGTLSLGLLLIAGILYSRKRPL